jgi:hypothetical protein
MRRLALFLAVVWSFAGPAFAGPLKIDRTIGKEPVYRTKNPKYGLLLFGPKAKDRVWLVLDGDTLYVDCNGNGDLTDPGEKIAAEKKPHHDPDEEGYAFHVGDLTVGGHKHKGLVVYFIPLRRFADSALGKRPDAKAVVTKDPKALVVRLNVDVDVPGMKGGGTGGRVAITAGPTDLTGVFQFAKTPTQAPAVHCAGSVQITFYGELPTLRVGRQSDLVLMVGTPGIGPGTFAMISYEDTIPATAKPVAVLSLPSTRLRGPCITQKIVIRDRC